MKVIHNIYEKAYVITLRRNGETFDMVLYGTNAEEIRERVEMELTARTEILKIRERGR